MQRIIIPIIAFILVSCLTITSEANVFDDDDQFSKEFMDATVRMINKSCPVNMGNGLIMIDAIRVNQILIYRYQYEDENINWMANAPEMVEEMMEEVKKDMIKEIKGKRNIATYKWMLDAMEQGYKFMYIYFAQDGNRLGSAIFTDKDFKEEKELKWK